MCLDCLVLLLQSRAVGVSCPVLPCLTATPGIRLRPLLCTIDRPAPRIPPQPRPRQWTFASSNINDKV